MAKKYSYWLNSGKYSMLQKVSMMLFGLLSFMVLTRSLSVEVLGVWGLFLIMSSIVETLRNSLIRNGYVLFMHTRDESEHPAIEYAALMTNIVYSVIFIVLFFALGGIFENVFNSPGLASVLYYYCATLVILVPFSYLEVFFVTRMDFKAIFWMYFGRNGLMLAGVFFLFITGKQYLNLPVLSILYGITAIAGLLIGIRMSLRHKRAVIKKDNHTLPQFIGFGKYVFSNNLFSLVFRSTDSFMTASVISANASAFYSTCTRITNLVDVPSQVFGDIMFPKAAQVMKQNDVDGLKKIYEKTVAATLTFTLPAIVVICLFPELILHILAGKDYVSAAPILRVIIFYGFFLPFIKQFGNVMDVLNRPQVNSLLMLCFAIINVGLNRLSLEIFGLIGSAYATLLSYFLLFVVTQIILIKRLKISQVNIFRNVLSFYPEYLKLIKGFLNRKAASPSS